MTATIQTIDTPDGAFTIVADDRGRVLASGWTADPEAALDPHPPAAASRRRSSRARRMPPPPRSRTTAATSRRSTTSRSRRTAPPMQTAGWAALRRIAPGHPLTYAEFAAALGQPSAVRAAASICARNAPALFVPCHRVLRADGSLGGFAWGLDVKRSLLDREAGELPALAPERRGTGTRFAFSELPGIGWRAVALARSPVRSHLWRMPCIKVAIAAKTAFVLRVAGPPRPRIAGVVAPPSRPGIRRLRHTAASRSVPSLEGSLRRAPRALSARLGPSAPPSPPGPPTRIMTLTAEPSTVRPVHPARARAAAAVREARAAAPRSWAPSAR